MRTSQADGAKGMVIRMNANKKRTQTARGRGRRQQGAWGLTCAVLMTAILLGCASCTRDEILHDPKDTGTSAGTMADTRPSGGGTGGIPGTGKPLDPDAGTVNPNGDAGDPPAAPDSGNTTKGFRAKFMH